MDHLLRQRSGGRLLATATLLVVLAIASGGPAAGNTDDAFHHDGWMGSPGDAFGYLWTTLWTVVSIGLGYLLLTYRDSGGGTTDDTLTVPGRRYAEGEIDGEEFETHSRELQGGE